MRQAKHANQKVLQDFHGIKLRWFVFCFFVQQKAFQERTVEIDMNEPRIALIEIGGSHDECLLTQMHALKTRGKEILLITTQEVVDRNPVFESYVHEFFVVDTTKASVSEIWKKLKASRVQLAVFNTAQGKHIRNLCLKALFHPITFVGIIHTTRMFTESFTQKIIHWKIKKYLLPSAYLASTVEPPKGIQVDYFYPLRFATMPHRIEKRTKMVAIIGGVEERRKDLTGFITMLNMIQQENVRFVFLGKSDPAKPEVRSFLKALQDQKLSDKVITFDSFVSQEVFDQTLQNVDLILPLVHPDTPSADQYFRNQISGAMTVAFGYKIPLLLHSAYQYIGEMQPASFYYELNSFTNDFTIAMEGSVLKGKEMAENSTFSNATQEERYLAFLGI